MLCAEPVNEYLDWLFLHGYNIFISIRVSGRELFSGEIEIDRERIFTQEHFHARRLHPLLKARPFSTQVH